MPWNFYKKEVHGYARILRQPGFFGKEDGSKYGYMKMTEEQFTH
jgi:hypothetical protein